MRRTILLLTVMGLTLALSATIALATVKVGTSAGETITGTDGNDQINGKGGNDDLRGKAGNDIYYFADGFGVDTLIDTAGTDTLSFSTLTTGVGVYLVPEWTSTEHGDWDAAYDGDDKVDIRSTSRKTSLIENVVGGQGTDEINGGKDENTLRPGGGADDELIDWGGYDGTSGWSAIPVSNDTYKGFKDNTGKDYVTDYGGTADVLDLKPYEAAEVYVDAVDLNGN